METFLQDVRYAVRQLWAARGLTALAVLTLALGIGSNAALYAVLESVLLRPLPYAHADRLVYIGPRQDTPSFSSTSWLNYKDIRDQTQTMQTVAGYVPDVSVVENAGEPKSTVAVRVTPNVFPMLGIAPLLGRTFTEEEGQTGGPQVAVLSESLWRHHFRADSHVVGHTVKVGALPRTIVGVMPDTFRFPDQGTSEMQDGLWLPLQPNGVMLDHRGWNGLSIVGKLRSGVTVVQAQAELNAIAERIRKADPDSTDADFSMNRLTLSAFSYGRLLTDNVRPAFYALLGAVAMVLLIACANVANLLIARFLGRRQEFAVRVALGAGRPRLVRQLLTEGALLSILGCLGGLALATFLLTFVHKLPDGTIPRASSIGTHWTILLALAVIATVVTVLSSLLPALLAAGTDPQTVLQAASRGLGSGTGGNRITQWLVTGEVALASLLLVGTGLLFHTLWNLEHTQLGFDAAHVTTVDAMPGNSAGLSSMSVSTDAAAAPPSVSTLIYQPVLERIRQEPGIQSAALITSRPFSGVHIGTGFEIVGQPKNPAGRDAQLTAVSEDYPRTMGIEILRGRVITDGDTSSAPYVAVINESLAKKYFGSKNPLQQQIDLGGKVTGMIRPYTVVGVIADQTQTQVGGVAEPLILLPYRQVPTTSLFHQALLNFVVSFVVKTRGNIPVAPEIRSAFHQYAPGYALGDFEAMQNLVNGALFSQKLSLYLTACFAGLAILMVVVGLYGVLAQLVGYRRHEIGIRMALGATREGMARMILRQGGILIGTGLAVGLLVSVALGQLVKSFLYQVPPLDGWTYAAVVLVSLPVGLLASLIPALRAASIEPMQALRDN